MDYQTEPDHPDFFSFLSVTWQARVSQQGPTNASTNIKLDLCFSNASFGEFVTEV